ncbi:MAG: hypothetical protein PHH77_00465 [Victivallaceae bacterium]|nr:hypothetical protein [Victivallaceae bacterium]
MKNLLTALVISVIFWLVSGPEARAAEYNVSIKVFSGEKSIPRQPFSYYIDFNREISPASVKMTITGKKTEIPVYILPVAKYRAKIYFMPPRDMDEDSESDYVLSFASGEWTDRPCGDAAFGKTLVINPNLIPNYSFEQVEKAADRFLTWTGKVSVNHWTLQDFGREFIAFNDLKSTCRVSTKEAFHGVRSLCFTNGKLRKIITGGQEREVLVSGSASLTGYLPLKPDTAYKLCFFVKITTRVDNSMNFQGVGVSLTFLDGDGKPVSNKALFSALYSINALPPENYLNRWVYVEACDVSTPDTRFGHLGIAEKISGVTYIDMLELREIRNCNQPEIIVGKIVDLTPKKPEPVLRRADGTPLK